MLGLSSGGHAGFSRAEGSSHVQMAQFPLGWQSESWGAAQGSWLGRPGVHMSGDRSLKTQPRIGVWA